jgi:hypothetical protein
MKRLALLALAVGCGTDPAQIAGTYTTALTNRDNGCNYGNWTVGGQASGIPVQFTQSDKSVSATVMGLAGGALSLAFGSNVFTGTIDGNNLDLTLTGNVGQNMGNCAYTRNAEIVGSYANNSITGSVRYTNVDNGNSDCLKGCISLQDFAGSRPPM